MNQNVRLLCSVSMLAAALGCGGGGGGGNDHDDDPVDTAPSLIYDGNGNTSGTAPEAADHAEGDTVVAAAPGDLALAGSCFAFWNTAANRSGTNYLVGQLVTIGATDTTLYAQWNTPPTLYLDGTEAPPVANRSRNAAESYAAALSVDDRDFSIDALFTMRLVIDLNNAALPEALFDTAAIQTTIDGYPTMQVATLSTTQIDVTGGLGAVRAVMSNALVAAPNAAGSIALTVTVHDNGHIGGCDITDQATLNVTFAL